MVENKRWKSLEERNGRKRVEREAEPGGKAKRCVPTTAGGLRGLSRGNGWTGAKEKERYEKMAEKMHKKRVERLKRKEKRNKLLNS